MNPAEIRWLRRGIVWLLAVAFVLLSASCRSNHNSARDSRKGPRPIAVLLYTNALDVSGPTPRVVVDENGQVVLTAWGTKWKQHRAFSLSAAELDALRKQVHEMAAMKPLRSYAALDDHHMVMDASYAQMYVRDGRHETAVSVYALENVLRENAEGMKLRPVEKGGPPPQFMNLYHRLKALAETQLPRAQRWTPRQIEVRLRDDFKNLDSPPVSWPKDWPTPNSPNANAHGDHEWHVLLDGSKFLQLRRLLPFEETYSPVKMEGEIWAACWRPILPGESGWWNAMMNSRR